MKPGGLKNTRVYVIFQTILLILLEHSKTLQQMEMGETRKKAYCLHPAILNSTFIVNLIVISKYSAVLEPVAQMFQTQRIDLSGVWKQIQLLISIFKEHIIILKANFTSSGVEQSKLLI